MRRELLGGLFAAGAFLASGVALAADGCAPATFSILHLPDGLAHTVFFDAFIVDAGSAGPATATATCLLEVVAPVAGYSVFSADYRGYAFLAPAQSLGVTALGGTPAVLVIGGPFDDVFSLTHLIGTAPGEALAIDLTLDLLAGAGPDAQGVIDTADFVRIGFTTWDSVQASLDQLARARMAVLGHLEGTAGLLLGFLQPIGAGLHWGPIAAAGSGLVGATGGFPIGSRFSLLGGAAYVAQSAPGVAIGPSLLLAGALRYLAPEGRPARFFAEAGVWGAPDLRLHFSRTYLNGDAMVVGEGDAPGTLAGLYGRAGAVFALDATNQLAVSATLSRSRLGGGGYVEAMSLANLFAAAVAGGVTSANSVKATVAWTHTLSHRFDMTLAAALGRTFGGSSAMLADIAWVGPVSGEAGQHAFVELGGRLGWTPRPGVIVDAFVLATAGGGGIGAHAQLGASTRLAF